VLKKIFKSKKGMTLMEILVGSIMLAVFAVAISMIIPPMLLAFMRANDFAEYNALLDSVGNQIVSDVVRASDPLTTAPAGGGAQVEIAGAVTGVDNVTIPITGAGNVEYSISAQGTLERGGAEVFPQGFYKGKEIGFTIRAHEDMDGAYEIVVIIRPLAGGNRFGLSGVDLERVFVARPLQLIDDTPPPGP